MFHCWSDETRNRPCFSNYGVFQNSVEAKGITTAHKRTSEFPSKPTIFKNLSLVKKAVIIPTIGSITAIIIADFENKSSLKNHAAYTIKEIKNTVTDMKPNFFIELPLSIINFNKTFTYITNYIFSPYYENS
jgi:hypothetical protein